MEKTYTVSELKALGIEFFEDLKERLDKAIKASKFFGLSEEELKKVGFDVFIEYDHGVPVKEYYANDEYMMFDQAVKQYESIKDREGPASAGDVEVVNWVISQMYS